MGRSEPSQVARAVLCVYLLLPSLPCANRLCFYSHITHTDKTAELILSECPPTKVCFTADGRYGNYSALVGRGCMEVGNCDQVHSLTLRGTKFTMRYACCDYDYCNTGPRVTTYSVPLILSMLTVAALLDRAQLRALHTV